MEIGQDEWLAKVVDNKQEQDTKQHCSNYQNHKHGEESSTLILAPATMFLQYNRRLLPMVRGKVGCRDGPG